VSRCATASEADVSDTELSGLAFSGAQGAFIWGQGHQTFVEGGEEFFGFFGAANPSCVPD
jgi:hypothetical protein